MKRLLILALALPAIAFGAWQECWVTGDTNLMGDTNIGDAVGDAITVAGSLTIQEVVLFDVGAVGAPGISFDGDPDSGRYWVGADSFADAVGGVQVALYDGTGVTAVGFNGPIGTVTPAAGTFTNADVGGTFNFGQDPPDLIAGFREISTYLTDVDGFDHGSDAQLAVDYDLTVTIGAGTNTTAATPGWNTLVTAAAGADTECTRSNVVIHDRAYEPRLECVIDLTTVAAGQTVFFGFWAAANEFAEIIHEPATSPNWLVRVDDAGGATTHDSGIAAAAGTPTKLAIWVDAAGAVSAAIDDVEVAVAGLDPMTANPHYAEWRLLNVGAGAKTIAVDYLISEQLKQQ